MQIPARDPTAAHVSRRKAAQGEAWSTGLCKGASIRAPTGELSCMQDVQSLA